LVDSFYNIIETCTDDCHICFVYTALCQDVAAEEELVEEVVSAIMNLDIVMTTQEQLSHLFDPAEESAAEAVPADESAAEAAAEAVPPTRTLSPEDISRLEDFLDDVEFNVRKQVIDCFKGAHLVLLRDDPALKRGWLFL
jgi:hypothetical protein